MSGGRETFFFFFAFTYEPFAHDGINRGLELLFVIIIISKEMGHYHDTMVLGVGTLRPANRRSIVQPEYCNTSWIR
jgi:hypothetical protein